MHFRLRGAIFGFAVGLSSNPGTAEVIDRIVAVIDRDVITLSEAELAREIGVLRSGGGGDDLPLTQVVERLIEVHLIEREVRRYRGEPVPSHEISRAMDAIRDSFPSGEAFREALTARGMDEDSLRLLVRRQIAISQYLERRFRPLVYVTDEEARRYYQEEILSSGGVVPPYEEVVEKIRQIVREKKFNQRVDDWIETLKSRTPIRRYVW